MTRTKGASAGLKAFEQEHRKREFSGQFEGLPLVDWLNQKPKSPKQKEQRERVIKLLRLLAESVRIQKAAGINASFAHLRAAIPIWRRTARLLSHYKYTPDLRLDFTGGLASSPPWKLPGIRDPYTDRKAVWAIVRLAERGKLSSVHECDGCGKWIFTKKSDHATCSAVCRARKRRQTLSDWDREAIRRKARERYAFKKRHQK